MKSILWFIAKPRPRVSIAMCVVAMVYAVFTNDPLMFQIFGIWACLAFYFRNDV